MSIIPRPLKLVLGRLIPFSLEDNIPTFNLGNGIPVEGDVLAIDANGDTEWTDVSTITRTDYSNNFLLMGG
jgi:hypothetical protein